MASKPCPHCKPGFGSSGFCAMLGAIDLSTCRPVTEPLYITRLRPPKQGTTRPPKSRPPDQHKRPPFQTVPDLCPLAVLHPLHVLSGPLAATGLLPPTSSLPSRRPLDSAIVAHLKSSTCAIGQRKKDNSRSQKQQQSACLRLADPRDGFRLQAAACPAHCSKASFPLPIASLKSTNHRPLAGSSL
jgi:hypothetical protein